jgi:PD-(D/E)XK nuclease superfamily
VSASPMTSTYSMWSLFRNCRKACEYRYEIGLVPREKDPNLSFGSLIHECLQIWHETRDLAAVLDFIDRACASRRDDDRLFDAVSARGI